MKIGSIFGIGLAVIAVLVGVSAFFGSFYTINERERGILLRNGALIGTVGPGLNYKLPFIDSVQEVSLETYKTPFENEPIYSKDQQVAMVNFSVNWRLSPDKVTEIYTKYRDAEGVLNRLIIPQVRKEIKEVFGQYTALTIIQQRTQLGVDLTQRVSNALDGNVLVLESFQIENVDFSDAYEASIEQRMLAEVEVQKLKQKEEQERVNASIVVIQAHAAADSKYAQAEAQAKSTRVNAEADAFAIELRGKAEASAIEVRGQALRDNPRIVDLVQAERWNGQLPVSMIPSSTVPFLNVNPTNQQ